MFPRFTLRTILVVTTLMAIFFVLVGAGTRGQLWAWGVAIGIASVAASLLVQGALFAIVWCIGRLATSGAGNGTVSPATTDSGTAT